MPWKEQMSVVQMSDPGSWGVQLQLSNCLPSIKEITILDCCVTNLLEWQPINDNLYQLPLQFGWLVMGMFVSFFCDGLVLWSMTYLNCWPLSQCYYLCGFQSSLNNKQLLRSGFPTRGTKQVSKSFHIKQKLFT